MRSIIPDEPDLVRLLFQLRVQLRVGNVVDLGLQVVATPTEHVSQRRSAMSARMR